MPYTTGLQQPVPIAGLQSPAGNVWIDGDGQMISPPQRR